MATYLTRINLDIEEKDFENALRFHVASAELKSLSQKTNKVVVVAHRGRPVGYDKKLSFEKFAPALSKKISKKVIFLKSFDLNKAKEQIVDAPNGSVFLLENIRFLPGERKNSRRLGKKLASLGDVFINNDFATSHRRAASLVSVTRYIPSKEGNILKNEVKALTKVRERSKSPFVLIIGGKKMNDKINAVKNLLPITDSILLGGGPANAFSKAIGQDIGKSVFDPRIMRDVSRLSKNEKFELPDDYIKSLGENLDIGPETSKKYASIIKEARTIVWGGPMGVFEKKKFANGNNVVARAVFKNKRAHTVIGGVETVFALPIKVTKQEYGNIFISTGGGAMLHFLAGQKLPGIEALKKNKR